jgi:hypothetical protein
MKDEATRTAKAFKTALLAMGALDKRHRLKPPTESLQPVAAALMWRQASGVWSTANPVVLSYPQHRIYTALVAWVLAMTDAPTGGEQKQTRMICQLREGRARKLLVAAGR